MDKAKKQQILVPVDFSEASYCAIRYAVEVAKIFKTEISLVSIINAKIKNQYSDDFIKEKLLTISNLIISDFNILTTTYIFHGIDYVIINNIIDNLHAIMVIAGLNNRQQQDNKSYFTANKIVSKFKELRIPVFVVQNKPPTYLPFKNIILPVDFRKQSKEKAPWAAFFGKLNNSKITIVYKTYKDEYFKKQLSNNLHLIKKSFDTFNVNYEIRKVEKINCSIDKYAVAFADVNLGEMVIVLMTEDFELDDRIFGPPEKKIISNTQQIPILCINPRDDLFIPCV